MLKPNERHMKCLNVLGQSLDVARNYHTLEELKNLDIDPILLPIKIREIGKKILDQIEYEDK